jgi:two-component system, cell cycle sensor histidine kinase and response regulator CckA
MPEKLTCEELEQRVRELELIESKRKRTEAELRESETRFRQLFDNMNSGVAVYEARDNGEDFVIRDFNRSAEKIDKVTKSDLIGRSVIDAFPGVVAFGLFEVFQRVWRTGTPEHHPIAHYEDNWIAGWRDNFVYKLPSGEIVAIYDDITERKRVEAALSESEENHRLLVQNLNAGVVIHAPDTSIILANERAAVLLGMTVGQMTGKTAIDPSWCFLREDGSPMPLVESPVNQVLSTKAPVHYVVVGINRPVTNDIVWVLVDAFPQMEADGTLRQIVLTFVDITERKRLENESERLQAQLNQAQKMESVGRLAGGVAHDFNNMLNVILGHAELALDDLPKGSPLRESLEAIKTSAEHSADLTHQLLAFARKQTIAPKTLDLNETVASMLKMLERLIGEDVDLLWKPSEDPAFVHVDPGQVDQLLANLVVNARDAIGQKIGKITIETNNATIDEACCAFHAGFQPGAYVVLSVSDDGCGMDKETLASIFEPFFTTKGPGEGTGLGLSTVYGIVKQNNGHIGTRSESDAGTTFRIYLPARKAARTLPRAATDAATPAARGSDTILVVEDESAILELTRTMLERQGYTVLTAATPGRAIALANTHSGRIDLLMTDVIMPEMNGRDLAKNMLAVYPDVRRLFMSGYTADIIAHQGVLDEGVHFIQKPFSMKSLAAKVRAALD